MVSSKINGAIIDEAFGDNHSLRKRVYDAIDTTPQHGALFEDIAKYTADLRRAGQSQQQAAEDGPMTKKRKLLNGANDAGDAISAAAGLSTDAPLQIYVQDMSFATPQRKKLTLEVTTNGYLRARNQTSKEIEFGLPLSKIQHVLSLPVPEKTQRQFNFCIIPQYGDGITPPPNGESVPESMVWTVPDTAPKTAYLGNGQPVVNESNPEETYEALIRRTLDGTLRQTKVTRPNEREFVSAVPEGHRKGENAYHVKAFRGSKEGYLFFLSTGIFFGYKKPLIFFAFENIESISYTSVLQHTFNLNIAVHLASAGPADGTAQEFEFSMLDQVNFAGIDAYIKRHGLQDASLAEARRAKKLGINGPVADDEAGDGQLEEEESELQKAQRELEDQEEEDEEDYDPGSDGDSDGSGSSSEESEGEGDAEEEEDDGEEGNLIEDELGSEAEQVEEEL